MNKKINISIPPTLLNISANFIGRLWVAIVGLVAIPIMVKGLGNELFGMYSLINILFVYLTLFDLGISKGIIKFISESISHRQDVEQRKIFYTVSVTYILLGLIVIVLIYFLTDIIIEKFLTSNSLETEIIRNCISLMSVSVYFLIIRSAFSGILVAHHKFVLLNFINSFFETFKWLSIIVFILLKYSILAVFVIQLIVTISQTLLLAGQALRFLPKVSIKEYFDPKIATQILNYSWPVALSDLIAKFIVHVDKIIFSLYYPVASLTYYVVSFQLASKVWEIPSNILSVFFPKFTQQFALTGKENIIKRYSQLTKLITISSLPILLALAFWGKPILRLWVNDDIAHSSYIVLAIFSVGVFLGCLALPAIYLANAIGWVKIPLKVHGLMAITNLVLCLILIPKYGLPGAAWSWSLSHSLEIFLMIPWVNKKLGINTLHFYGTNILKPLILTISLFLIIYIISINRIFDFWSLIVWILIFSILYFSITYVFLFIKEERNFIKVVVGNLIWKR